MGTQNNPSAGAPPAVGRSLVTDVVRAVAEVRDRDPLEMPPLAQEVDFDVEALERLVSRDSGPSPEIRGTVAFRYDGSEVELHPDGTVEVQQPSEDRLDTIR